LETKFLIPASYSSISILLTSK